MPAKKTEMTEAERSQRFVEKARELGADGPEAEAEFRRAFEKVVKPKQGVRKTTDR